MFNSTGEPSGTSNAIAGGNQSQPRAHSAAFLPPDSEVAGIDLRSLLPGTELHVDTRNSHYRIQMLHGNECNAVVKGGRYFFQEAEARIDGATIAGHVVKAGWICLGFCLELSVHGKRIVTSRVRSISVEPLPRG